MEQRNVEVTPVEIVEVLEFDRELVLLTEEEVAEMLDLGEWVPYPCIMRD